MGGGGGGCKGGSCPYRSISTFNKILSSRGGVVICTAGPVEKQKVFASPHLGIIL